MDTYIIMPDCSLEHDTDGIVPPECPRDPIDLQDDRFFQRTRLYLDLHYKSELPEVLMLNGDLYAEGTPFVRYLDMRIEGQSHNMALMLASRKFPGIRTDATFNHGKFSGDDGRVGPEQEWLRARAEEAGVSTTGKWYCRGLASFPGDPTAWIDGLSDVRRIAKEKNMTVHGYVEQKGHETAPIEDLTIDPRLVEAEARDICESNPGAVYDDVYARVEELRSGRVDPNPLLVEDSTDDFGGD